MLTDTGVEEKIKDAFVHPWRNQHLVFGRELLADDGRGFLERAGGNEAWLKPDRAGKITDVSGVARQPVLKEWDDWRVAKVGSAT